MHFPQSCRSTRARSLTVLAVALVAVVALAGTAFAHASSAPLKISNAWARTSPMEATKGAVYLTIDNTGDEDNALVAAKVPQKIAMETQIHETTMGDGGAMQMQEVDQIDLPAGKVTKLKPGGYHIMLMELAEPLEVGATFKVTLMFEEGKNKSVKVTVKK